MEYKTTIQPIFKQKLPKKIVKSKRIRVRKGYEAQVSFWIMDMPYSKEPPAICMTIRHGKAETNQYIRLAFPDIEDLKFFFGEINNFCLDNIEILKEELDEAIEEWIDLHFKITEYNLSKENKDLTFEFFEKNSKIHNENNKENKVNDNVPILTN